MARRQFFFSRNLIFLSFSLLLYVHLSVTLVTFGFAALFWSATITSWLISALVIHLYKIHISKRGAVRRHMLPQRWVLNISIQKNPIIFFSFIYLISDVFMCVSFALSLLLHLFIYRMIANSGFLRPWIWWASGRHLELRCSFICVSLWCATFWWCNAAWPTKYGCVREISHSIFYVAR